MKLFYITLGIFFIISCKSNSNSKNESAEAEEFVAIDSTLIQDEIIPENSEEEITPSELNLKDLTLYCDNNYFAESANLSNAELEKDTIVFDQGLFSKIPGTISLSSKTVRNLKLEQSYETSISVGYDGKNCVLDNWKHYTDNWDLRGSEVPGVVIPWDYSDPSYLKFPEITSEELYAVMQKECSEIIVNNIGKENLLKNENVNKVVSSILFRITGDYKQKSKGKFEKIIKIKSQIGC